MSHRGQYLPMWWGIFHQVKYVRAQQGALAHDESLTLAPNKGFLSLDRPAVGTMQTLFGLSILESVASLCVSRSFSVSSVLSHLLAYRRSWDFLDVCEVSENVPAFTPAFSHWHLLLTWAVWLCMVLGESSLTLQMLSSDLAGKGDREGRAPAEDSPKPKIQRVRAPTTSACMPFPGSPHADSQHPLPKDRALPDQHPTKSSVRPVFWGAEFQEDSGGGVELTAGGSGPLRKLCHWAWG
nr:uncharacterized protein LOC129017628 [Pongo pygmaeus]